MGTVHHLKLSRQPSLPAPGDGPDDPALIERCRRGDRQALQSVLRAHSDFLERLLIRVAGPSLAPDVLQATLVAAVRAFPRFRGEAQVRTWLARIAIRSARAELRRAHRRVQVLNETAVAAAVSMAPSPERGAVQDQILKRVQHHLDAIKPNKRIAFILHVVEGYSMEEVAALTGAGVPATKSRVFWARRELIARGKRDPVLRERLEDGGWSL